MRPIMLPAAACLLLLISALPAAPQARKEAKLSVTVVDQTTAVIPSATVTVVGIEESNKKVTIPPTKTSDRGVAVFDHLAPGRYSVTGEFPGFDLGLLRDIRVKAGDNKHVLVLPLQKMAAEITVGRDAQTAASDRASTFGTAMTREQLEALSEDPNEMQRQIQEMAGPGATIRVDSFEGQQLPPKAQIKAIHISRDTFAAENHSAGGIMVDIITQPGIGPLRGSARFGFYDSALDGRNALIPKKGPARNESFSVSLGGSLAKEKSSFSISASASNNYTTPNLYLATPGGRLAENLNLRQPSTQLYFYGSLDYAVTKDQTLRVGFNTSRSRQENQGVGAYDLKERAYSSKDQYTGFRLQEAGPLGRRFFINTRLSVTRTTSSSESVTQAPTVIVTDAFTGGGAQRAGGRTYTTVSLASDLDYVRGRHSWRGGVQLNGSWYRSDDSSNYLGTYTFVSLAAYEAGTPRGYTRRFGDPLITYSNIQAGLYVQDDIRLRKNLTLSPGVRLEAQTHVPGRPTVGPRMGITWSPFKNGKTTLRASAGLFYDWLGTGIYEQTIRVDGVHQREMNIVDPSYPDPGNTGLIPPTNRYLLSPDLGMGRTTRVSLGVDQQITKLLRLGATYARTHGDNLLVGRNLNAPVGGVRPDQGFSNVIEAVPEGSSRAHTLSIDANFNLSASTAAALGSSTGPRFSWRRGLMATATYYVAKAENNSDGAFSVPATGSLATEWGPSSGDVRHRAYATIYSGALKNLTAGLNINLASGAPYTIRTGYDDNGDLIFNDRPAGVGRNTERAGWSWNSSAYFSYTLGLGKRTVALPPGIMITGSSAGGYTVGTVNQQPAARYRINFSVQVQNLTNHANYIGYSGVMTSPFFRQPTAVSGVRSVYLNTGFSF